MKSIQEIIRERKPEALVKIEELVGKNGESLEQNLLKSKVMDDRELLGVLSEFYEFPYTLNISERDIDEALVKSIPISFAKKFKLIPFQKSEGKVVVIFAPPLNLYVLDEVKSLFGCEIEPTIALNHTVIDAINRVYERGKEMSEGIDDDEAFSIAEYDIHEPQDLLDAEDEAPIIKFVNSLVFEAIKEKASDIHIECFEKRVSVRFRKDGILHEITSVPKKLQASIISRVKIMADLDIAEKRKPQDGRIHIKVAGRDVDVRVSTVPTTWGESVVMRLLDRSSVLLNLEDLGLEGSKLEKVEGLIHRPHGIILVTGPTGCGKTTTLYAALQRINSPNEKIITVEDPVEYQIQGINQIQVNTKVNLSFANGLRSILRQDPDIILVGEIRDRETADIAIHASLTGHLVFSTLHTNNASSAITRLIDMEIEPFLVASSLVAVIAQRLTRLLCGSCKKPYRPSDDELVRIGIRRRDLPDGVLYDAKGCEMCLGMGYSGRIAIFEILVMDDEIRNMTLTHADSTTIQKKAVERGMLTLKSDGIDKVIKGFTSAHEVMRVTEEENLDS